MDAIKTKRMKSIKEKSENYISGFHPSIQRMCKESFEDGANYVLDAIEECFNPKNDIVKQWGAIATLIEQLKSNQ